MGIVTVLKAMVSAMALLLTDRYYFRRLTLGKMAAREQTVRISNKTSPTARVT